MKRFVALPAVLLALLVLALPAAAAAGTYTYQYSFRHTELANSSGFVQTFGICYSNGHVYVTDEFHDQIVDFYEDGRFYRTLGEYGTDPGQLRDPVDISIGSSGMWVSEWYTPKIMTFPWSGTSDELNLGSAVPAGILVDSGGYVWVCTTAGLRKYGTADYRLLATIPGNFSDVTQRTNGNLLVTDYIHDGIFEYTYDGQYVGQIASYGTDPGQVIGPWGIDMAPEGIVVADDANNRVQILGAAGQVLPQPPNYGGEFSNPVSVAVGPGKIFVADNNAIRCYSTGSKASLTLTKSPPKSSYTLTRKGGLATWTYKVTVRKSGGALVAGKSMRLQRSLNGTRWTTKYILSTNSSGVASKKLSFTSRGTSYWRWYSPATTEYKAASAAKTKLVVR